MPQYDIPTENLTRLTTIIEKLNRKAARLKVPPITFTFGARGVRQVDVKQDYLDPYTHETRTYIEPTFIEYTTVSVEGITPHFEGWDFIAKIEDAGTPVEVQHPGVDKPCVTGISMRPGTGAIIKTSPHARWELPAQFREISTLRCDHCRTERYRRATYVIRHSQTGEWKVVGNTCLKDFMGSRRDPEAIAKFFEEIHEKIEESADLGSGGYRTARVIPRDEFLKRAAQYISGRGWHSARSEDGQPTGWSAVSSFYPPPKRRRDEKYDYEILLEEMTPGQHEHAAELFNEVRVYLQEFLSIPDDQLDDFGHNLKVIMSKEYFPEKHASFAAAIFPSYWRAHPVQRKEREQGGFVGEVGGKIEADVVLRYMGGRDTMYGFTFIYRFSDEHNNWFTWFTGSVDFTQVYDEHVNTPPNNVYHIIATVKKHDVYQGLKSTVITRVKVAGVGKIPPDSELRRLRVKG